MKRECIEQLIKERLPVHQKCLGQGFSIEDQKFLKSQQCKQIEPIGFSNTSAEETNPTCLCKVYVDPATWWRHEGKRCPMGDHFRPDLEIKSVKSRVGQQKQTKKKTKKK